MIFDKDFIAEWAKEVGNLYGCPQFTLEEILRPDIRISADGQSIFFDQYDWDRDTYNKVLIQTGENAFDTADTQQVRYVYRRPMPTYERQVNEKQVATDVRGGIFSTYVHEYTTLPAHTETKVDIHGVEELIVEALEYFPLDTLNLYNLDPDVNKRKYITEKVIENHRTFRHRDIFPESIPRLDGREIEPLRQWTIQ